MKKAIAVPYIIAIVLGIIVIGLVGYWMYVAAKRVPGEMSLNDCRTLLITKYCPEAITEGWLINDASWGSAEKFGVDVNEECKTFIDELGVDDRVGTRIACGLPA